MLEQLRGLRELSSLLAAAEASVTAAFVVARRAEQVAAGVPARRVGQGIGREVGLARRESPNRAGRYVGFAGVLTRELPETYAALRAGETSEWRAMLVARETGWLSVEHRGMVDAELGPRLASLGDLQVEAEAAKLAYRLDPRGKIRAIERAAGGRLVSLRPAPDGQCRFNATLPLAQGVAAYAALCKVADGARAAGDERGRGQVMADELITRVTGQSGAELVPLRADLIMTDQALFTTGPNADEPATVSGHGPVPAPHARDLIRARRAPPGRGCRYADCSPTPPAASSPWKRQPATSPPRWPSSSGCATSGAATPFCGAPIRHTDHIVPYADGGPTSLDNAAGLCEACNYAKQAPGWQTVPQPDGTVRTTTPTGHDAQTFTQPIVPDEVKDPGSGRRHRRRPRLLHPPLLASARVDYAEPPRSVACFYD